MELSSPVEEVKGIGPKTAQCLCKAGIHTFGDLIYSRNEFENDIKEAAAGKVFKRTIIDDTQPGGPVERTIEYVAPFDKCDREKDYETAWAFFEKKYGKVGE